MSQIFNLVAAWSGVGQLFENVLHYQVEETGTHSPEDYANGLIEAWKTAVLPDWQDCISTDVELVSLRSKRISGAGSTTVIQAYASGTYPGTIGASIDNTALAGILEFPYFAPPSVAFPSGRTNIGKIFVGGMPDSATTQNTINSTERTLLTTLMNTIVVPITIGVPAVTATYVVYNRSTKTAHVPVGKSIALKIGIQKRRLIPVFP